MYMYMYVCIYASVYKYLVSIEGKSFILLDVFSLSYSSYLLIEESFFQYSFHYILKISLQLPVDPRNRMLILFAIFVKNIFFNCPYLPYWVSA